MRKLKLWHFCQHGSADTTSVILGALRVLCVLNGREVLPLLRSEVADGRNRSDMSLRLRLAPGDRPRSPGGSTLVTSRLDPSHGQRTPDSSSSTFGGIAGRAGRVSAPNQSRRISALASKVRLNKHGTRNIVKSVETIKPPSTTLPTPR